MDERVEVSKPHKVANTAIPWSESTRGKPHYEKSRVRFAPPHCHNIRLLPPRTTSRSDGSDWKSPAFNLTRFGSQRFGQFSFCLSQYLITNCLILTVFYTMPRFRWYSQVLPRWNVSIFSPHGFQQFFDFRWRIHALWQCSTNTLVQDYKVELHSR